MHVFAQTLRKVVKTQGFLSFLVRKEDLHPWVGKLGEDDNLGNCLTSSLCPRSHLSRFPPTHFQAQKMKGKKDFKRPWLAFFPWHFGHCRCVSLPFFFAFVLPYLIRENGGEGRTTDHSIQFSASLPHVERQKYSLKKEEQSARAQRFSDLSFRAKKVNRIAHLI